MTNMRDGLGFEEVNQEVTDTEIISGNNIYATTAVTTPTVVATTTLSGAAVNATNISGTDIINAEGELQSVSIGSATAIYGAKIQAGSETLSADSGAWVVYPVAYSNSPIVTVTNLTTVSSDVNVLIGSLNAGSAWIEGETAADEFSWIAVGI